MSLRFILSRAGLEFKIFSRDGRAITLGRASTDGVFSRAGLQLPSLGRAGLELPILSRAGLEWPNLSRAGLFLSRGPRPGVVGLLHY